MSGKKTEAEGGSVLLMTEHRPILVRETAEETGKWKPQSK